MENWAKVKSGMQKGLDGILKQKNQKKTAKSVKCPYMGVISKTDSRKEKLICDVEDKLG